MKVCNWLKRFSCKEIASFCLEFQREKNGLNFVSPLKREAFHKRGSHLMLWLQPVVTFVLSASVNKQPIFVVKGLLFIGIDWTVLLGVGMWVVAFLWSSICSRIKYHMHKSSEKCHFSWSSSWPSKYFNEMVIFRLSVVFILFCVCTWAFIARSLVFMPSHFVIIEQNFPHTFHSWCFKGERGFMFMRRHNRANVWANFKWRQKQSAFFLIVAYINIIIVIRNNDLVVFPAHFRYCLAKLSGKVLFCQKWFHEMYLESVAHVSAHLFVYRLQERKSVHEAMTKRQMVRFLKTEWNSFRVEWALWNYINIRRWCVLCIYVMKF